MQQAKTSDAIVSPVSAADLADFLGVDASNSLLPGLLTAATDAAIRYLNTDLIGRDWTLYLDRYPYVGTNVGGISPRDTKNLPWISLPWSKLISVNSIKVIDEDGTETTLTTDEYEVDTNQDPGRVQLDYFPLPTKELSGIQIAYTAGYDNDSPYDDIPEGILLGIKMYAAWLYEHRGECDAMDGLNKSGAASLLRPYRVEWMI